MSFKDLFKHKKPFKTSIIEGTYQEMKKEIEKIIKDNEEKSLFLVNDGIINFLSGKKEISIETITKLVKYAKEFLSPYAQAHLFISLVDSDGFRKAALEHPYFKSFMIDVL